MLLPWISVWTQRKKYHFYLFSKIMQRNFFFVYKTMQRNAVLLVCFLFINVVSCYLQWWCTVCGGLVLGESEIFLAPPFPTPVILQNWHPVAPSNQLISYPDLLLPPPPFHFQIIGATTSYVSPYHSTLCYYRKYFKSFAVQWNECEEFC